MLMICSIVFADSSLAITLSEKSLVLIQGKTEKLVVSTKNIANAKKLKYVWKTSNSSIATVQSGTVKGVNPGTATITCSTIYQITNNLICFAFFLIYFIYKEKKPKRTVFRAKRLFFMSKRLLRFDGNLFSLPGFLSAFHSVSALLPYNTNT